MISLAPVIFIVATLIGLSVIAGKIPKVPYPILLVLAGLVIGLIPGLPVLNFNPETILLVFLPPLLYRAGWDTSVRDFRESIRPISRLAIGLVLLTTLAVAVVAHYLIPGMGWATAFVLGAVISPPDAVSATSIIKGMGLNKRIVTILEGESLVNDASALIAYRYAVAAVTSTAFVLWRAGFQFLLVAGGGILIGLAMGYLLAYILKRIHNNPMVESCLSLLTPFITYPLAEHLGASGVLAVVCSGLVTSWLSPEIFSYQGRTQTNAVWDLIGFLMNGIIFILIGFQLSNIIDGLHGYELSELIRYGLIISAVTVLARLLFIAPVMVFPKMLASEVHQKEKIFDWKNVIILSWSGMRGVVSLATAMALPLVMDNGHRFPHRNLVIFITFVVILVTLVGQGLTLPFLIRMLKIAPDPHSEDEERKLRLLLANSSLDYINDHFSNNKHILEEIRKLYELRINWLMENPKVEKRYNPQDNLLTQVIYAQLEVTRFKRELLVKLYRDGNYSAENIRKLERELDFDESRLRSQL